MSSVVQFVKQLLNLPDEVELQRKNLFHAYRMKEVFRILVLGPQGVGKSSTVNSMLKVLDPETECPASVGDRGRTTVKISKYEFKDLHLELIDCVGMPMEGEPGPFDDLVRELILGTRLLGENGLLIKMDSRDHEAQVMEMARKAGAQTDDRYAVDWVLFVVNPAGDDEDLKTVKKWLQVLDRYNQSFPNHEVKHFMCFTHRDQMTVARNKDEKNRNRAFWKLIGGSNHMICIENGRFHLGEEIPTPRSSQKIILRMFRTMFQSSRKKVVYLKFVNDFLRQKLKKGRVIIANASDQPIRVVLVEDGLETAQQVVGRQFDGAINLTAVNMGNVGVKGGHKIEVHRLMTPKLREKVATVDRGRIGTLYMQVTGEYQHGAVLIFPAKGDFQYASEMLLVTKRDKENRRIIVHAPFTGETEAPTSPRGGYPINRRVHLIEYNVQGKEKF